MASRPAPASPAPAVAASLALLHLSLVSLLAAYLASNGKPRPPLLLRLSCTRTSCFLTLSAFLPSPSQLLTSPAMASHAPPPPRLRLSCTCTRFLPHPPLPFSRLPPAADLTNNGEPRHPLLFLSCTCTRCFLHPPPPFSRLPPCCSPRLQLAGHDLPSASASPAPALAASSPSSAFLLSPSQLLTSPAMASHGLPSAMAPPALAAAFCRMVARAHVRRQQIDCSEITQRQKDWAVRVITAIDSFPDVDDGLKASHE
ncbi:unnamed protein product [Closterium sp. NIES-65]|nr:unnamed protein product [Closterium sp. NIES-65]